MTEKDIDDALDSLFPPPVQDYDKNKPLCSIRPNDKIEIAYSTLSSLLLNLEKPDEKYRTIKLTNPAIKARICSIGTSPVEFLKICGFIQDGDTLTIPRDENGDDQLQHTRKCRQKLDHKYREWLAMVRQVEGQNLR